MNREQSDFSLSLGAPLNKSLIYSAAREAQIMADGEQYDAAINQLQMVSLDSPHFGNARDLMNTQARRKRLWPAVDKQQQ